MRIKCAPPLFGLTGSTPSTLLSSLQLCHFDSLYSHQRSIDQLCLCSHGTEQIEWQSQTPVSDDRFRAGCSSRIQDIRTSSSLVAYFTWVNEFREKSNPEVALSIIIRQLLSLAFDVVAAFDELVESTFFG